MNIRNFLHARCMDVRVLLAQRRVLRQGPPVAAISPTTWPQSISNPREFYLDCFRYFHRCLPPCIKTHRRYFQRKKRGFGEDAFHTMWFLLLREFQPRNFLEIGVYRGQTLSLIALLARHHGFVCEVHGTSPFSSAGDSVSRYCEGIDYYDDTLKNFNFFSLSPPQLLRAYSTDPLARKLITSRSWDLIYIDGNHDYAVARADWELCSAHVRPGGL